MSDELQNAEHRANRLADQVESLRGQNNTLSDTVHCLRESQTNLAAARNKACQQRDQLLIVAGNLQRSGAILCIISSGTKKELDAAIANCKVSK